MACIRSTCDFRMSLGGAGGATCSSNFISGGAAFSSDPASGGVPMFIANFGGGTTASTDRTGDAEGRVVETSDDRLAETKCWV